MSWTQLAGGTRYNFPDLKTLLARASPPRSGDDLAGLSASSAQERVAAQMALADLPLKAFLKDFVIPCETDEVSRLIAADHDPAAFAIISHLTVGEFRDWLLSEQASAEILTSIAPGMPITA